MSSLWKTESPAEWLRIDPLSPLQASSLLAVVNADDGRVEHLSPGSWPEGQRRWPSVAGSAAVAVDIVMRRMTIPTQQCRALALGQCVAEWHSVAWPQEAELRAGGRTLGTARAVMVEGCQGYEVMGFTPGSLQT